MKAERFGIVKRLVTRRESSPARIAGGFSIPMNEGKCPAFRFTSKESRQIFSKVNSIRMICAKIDL